MKRLAAAALCLVAGVAASLERAPVATTEQNYTLFCAGCHTETGRGVKHRVPQLAGRLNLFVGVEGGRDYLMRVPGVANSQLDDARLAAVLNLAVARFAPESAGRFRPVTAAEMAEARTRPLIGIEAERTRLLRLAGVSDAEIAASY